MGTLTDVPRPATGKTPIRNFRIDGEVYDPAVRIAWARGESLTEIVEKAVAAYARKHRADDPGADVYRAARAARTAPIKRAMKRPPAE